MLYDTIERVSSLAAERGLTLPELCADCKVNYRSLARAQQRGGQLSLDTIGMFCKALGIDYSEFFSVPEFYIDQGGY